MDFQQTVDWLYSQLPAYQRQGGQLKLSLDKTRKLCAYLGNPEQQLACIHIAGTNGKGSTASMLAAVLTAAGYRTGLYTSPHLLCFTERIRIDGVNMPQAQVVEWVAQHKDWLTTHTPSFFELTFGMAMDVFAAMEVDVAVVETGMGGRLDSTNVILPHLSLITNIDWDHMQYLGDTLPKIAAEKAGIMKSNVPCILGSYQEETFPVFVAQAEQVGTQVFPSWYNYRAEAGAWQPNGQRAFHLTHEDLLEETEVLCDLGGDYQAHNLPAVFMAIDMLAEQGWELGEEAIREGLANVRTLAGLRGRFEQPPTDARLILDVAHNAAGLSSLFAQLAAMVSPEALHLVVGTVADKDLSRILPLFPKQAHYYVCAPDLPRAYPAADFAHALEQAGCQAQCYASVAEALQAAQQAAPADARIVVTGSTFVVAEALAQLEN